MKALVYQGPDKKALEERPVPKIKDSGDAIVRIVKTTICGTDLHIFKGDVPSCAPGHILGHEGVGVIEKTGPGVTTFHQGDHVLISCISACGKCDYCRRGMYSHCTTGGWTSAIRSMARRPSMCVFPMRTRASIRFRRALTKRHW